MRNLILLAGVPDAGKSQAAHNLGLGNWLIDTSSLFRQAATPVLNDDGELYIRPTQLNKAKDSMLDVVRSKMIGSELIVLDVPGDLRDPQSVLSELLALADRYRYATTIVDFDTGSPLKSFRLPNISFHGRRPFARVLTPHEFFATFDDIKNPVHDISHVDAIVAIGDIHANADALQACLTQAEGKGKIAFVFTGDFINKGPDPVKTLRLLSEFRKRNPDTFMVSGNHEIMLENWAWRRGPSKDIFARDTLPDIQAKNYSRKEARSFLVRLSDHIRLSWRGYDISVTHAGLSAPCDILGLLPGSMKRSGIGHVGTDIDRLWERNSRTDKSLQIHGHRNTHQVSVDPTQKSFNLEGIDAFGQIQGMVLRPDKADGVQVDKFSLPISPLTRRRQKGATC